MKLSDLIEGCGGGALSARARWGKSEVTLRLVPEGVLQDIRACVGAPVPPKDQENAALMSLYQAESRADHIRMELLEIAASAGVTAEVVVTFREGGVKRETRASVTAGQAAARDVEGAERTVAQWVDKVLPALSAMTEVDLRDVREKYRGLCQTAPKAFAGAISEAGKKSEQAVEGA